MPVLRPNKGWIITCGSLPRSRNCRCEACTGSSALRMSTVQDSKKNIRIDGSHRTYQNPQNIQAKSSQKQSIPSPTHEGAHVTAMRTVLPPPSSSTSEYTGALTLAASPHLVLSLCSKPYTPPSQDAVSRVLLAVTVPGEVARTTVPAPESVPHRGPGRRPARSSPSTRVGAGLSPCGQQDTRQSGRRGRNRTFAAVMERNWIVQVGYGCGTDEHGGRNKQMCAQCSCMWCCSGSAQAVHGTCTQPSAASTTNSTTNSAGSTKCLPRV